MNPERTKENAPERVYLGYTSFWYETSEEDLHDIEYIRADLIVGILCAECESGREPIFDAEARWFYHGKGRKAVGCSAGRFRLGIAALKAAAEQKEEGK